MFLMQCIYYLWFVRLPWLPVHRRSQTQTHSTLWCHWGTGARGWQSLGSHTVFNREVVFVCAQLISVIYCLFCHHVISFSYSWIPGFCSCILQSKMNIFKCIQGPVYFQLNYTTRMEQASLPHPSLASFCWQDCLYNDHQVNMHFGQQNQLYNYSWLICFI